MLQESAFVLRGRGVNYLHSSIGNIFPPSHPPLRPYSFFFIQHSKNTGPGSDPTHETGKGRNGFLFNKWNVLVFFTNPYIQNPQVYVGAAFKASLSSEDIEMHRIYVPELIVEEVFLPTLEPKQPNSPLTLECKVMGRRGWKWGIRRR